MRRIYFPLSPMYLASTAPSSYIVRHNILNDPYVPFVSHFFPFFPFPSLTACFGGGGKNICGASRCGCSSAAVT